MKLKWKAPKAPRNVLIADWWDRSPCVWICDLTKLDESDPVQAEYKKTVLEAVQDMHSFMDGSLEWPIAGEAEVPDSVTWTSGRPEEVCHAVVLPPCTIDAYVTLHYPS